MATRVLNRLRGAKHGQFGAKHGQFGAKHPRQCIHLCSLIPVPSVFTPPVPLTGIEAGFYVLVLGVLRDAPA